MTQETMKLALEALISITDAIYVNSEQEANAVYKANDAITAIKEALAQPEQEPVAWMFEFPDKRLAPKFDSAPHGGNWKPLYTTPPQRTWVGLSDEERKDIELGIEVFGTSVEDVLKEAEAKLKEKNT